MAYSAAEKAVYKETKRAEIERYSKDLAAGIEKTKTSAGFRAMLDTMATFPVYSFNNIVMIMLQKPDATLVASYKMWQKKHRQVRKGEHGIKIWAPCIRTVETEDDNGEIVTKQRLAGFKLVSVFDVSQTDGEALPDIAPELAGAVDDFDSIFEAVCQAARYIVSVVADVPGGAKGCCDHMQGQITIKEGLSETQQIKTLIHEAAHSRLHSIDCDKSREQKEIEAESVAYIVCRRLGINTDDYSIPYVASWTADIEAEEYIKIIDGIRAEALAMIEDIEHALSKAA